MPHSYGSSFTLLYFFDETSCDMNRVRNANPMATSRKRKIGIYALSILWSQDCALWEMACFITRGHSEVKKRNCKRGKGFWPILAINREHLRRTMNHKPLPFLLLATVLVATVAIRAQQGTFRSAIDVVSMNVTVTDTSNSTTRYITDLTEKDFEI